MTNETHLELIQREIKMGDQVQIGVCGPGQKGIVKYLGESPSLKGAIRVRGPFHTCDLYWGNILYLAPMGVTLESVKWNTVPMT